jgi:hypothetical protein
LFVAIFTLSFLYGSAPNLWRVLIQTVAGVVTARLVAAFVKEPWIKRAIYILILVMIGFQALLIAGVPMAPMRLFLLIVVRGRSCLFRLAGPQKSGCRQTGMAGVAAPAGGRRCLPSSPWRMSSALAILRSRSWMAPSGRRFCCSWGGPCSGWSAWPWSLGVRAFPMDTFAFFRQNADAILRRVIFFANTPDPRFRGCQPVWWPGSFTPFPWRPCRPFFTFGVTIGEQRITIGLVVTAALILYGAFVLPGAFSPCSWKMCSTAGQMDTGARFPSCA